MIEGTHTPAQSSPHCGVTDAMCEAAVQVEASGNIQGFTYATRHVIRDVSKPYDRQKLWEIDKNDADAEEKFYHQCRIERMRQVLVAALLAAQGKPDCGAWRPIETAPRDEVVLICGFAYRGYYVTDAKLIDGTWLLFDPASDSYSVESGNHSGWMPRPTPPSSVTSTDKTGAAS